LTKLRRSRAKDTWDGPAPLALPAVLYLDPDPQAASKARSFVLRQCLAKGITGDTLETAVLLTSEIVTNACIHAGTAARLEVTTSADGLIVEVGDADSRLPKVIDPDPEALHGRGLAIVSTLAADWGAHEDDWGKVVWFEIQYDH
jgi:anti-sigma regulatory factor (Ser/Thr protein kinase)